MECALFDRLWGDRHTLHFCSGVLGFDTKILKKVIQIRKQDKDERMEQEAILETYLAALGMIEGPPDEG